MGPWSLRGLLTLIALRGVKLDLLTLAEMGEGYREWEGGRILLAPKQNLHEHHRLQMTYLNVWLDDSLLNKSVWKNAAMHKNDIVQQLQTSISQRNVLKQRKICST